MTRTRRTAPDPPRTAVAGAAPGARRRRASRPAIAVALSAVGILVLGACGGDDGADEAKGGLDVGLEDGGLSLGTDEGSFDVSTEDELPEGFPEVVPLPEDYTVTVSNRSTTAGGTRWDVGLSVDAAPSEVFEALTGGFDGEEWTEQSKATTEVQGRNVSAANYDDGELLVSVNVTSAEEGSGSAVFITVTPSPT